VQLALHPQLGFWFGLRAVVVFDAPPPPAQRPARSPCSNCPKPCVAPFERALEEYRIAGEASVADSWERWLAVRDACPVGRQHRYGDEQVRYHYTKDLARLHALADGSLGAAKVV
jgi:methylmalonic aciduria homocystinuria type C protein